MTFPQYVTYVDTETKQIDMDVSEGKNTIKQIEQRFWFGCSNYVDYTSKAIDVHNQFDNVTDFWKYQSIHWQGKKKYWVIAHNQDFDFRVLNGFTEMRNLGFELKSLIADGTRFIARYEYDKDIKPEYGHPIFQGRDLSGCSVQIIDTLNFFKMSLAKMGDILGIPKLDFPGYDAPFSQWITYCNQDVFVLRKAFEAYIQFIKDNDLGTFGMTMAKQALNAYRYRFMKHEIFIHCDPKAVKMERESYTGGRTEAFFIGHEEDGPYYKVDINSMYPYVMHGNNFPCRLIGVRSCMSSPEIPRMLKAYGFIALCDVQTDVACLPYRMDNRLCFPIGKFTGTYCQPEIEKARECGAKITLRKIAFYEMAPLFKSWVEEMYALRQQLKDAGNTQYEKFTKLLMNSLYGKFGQRNPNWESIGESDKTESWSRTFIDGETGKERKVKCVNGNLFENKGMNEGFDSLVAIASFVTSYARSYLLDMISTAKQKNVYYMDTDSLIVNQQGFDYLASYLDENELGYLKLEETDSQVTIHGLKDYFFAGKVVIKGISSKARIISDTQFEVEQWEHLNGAVQRGRLETVVVKTVIKTLSRDYRKGIIKPSGRVKPFQIGEDTLFSL